MLVFLDSSDYLHKDRTGQYSTWAGVAFESADYTDFCRKFFRLKQRFFKRQSPQESPLRGKSILGPRGMESYRKVEFAGEVFSLCRLTKAVVFSVTRSEEGFSQNSRDMLLAYLMERVNSFAIETSPEHPASLIFKTETGPGVLAISDAVMNLMFRTPFGGGFRGIAGSPLFVPFVHSPGVQVANLFAYIINQHHAGRRTMREFFEEVETLQYVSAIHADEYEITGMTVIE